MIRSARNEPRSTGEPISSAASMRTAVHWFAVVLAVVIALFASTARADGDSALGNGPILPAGQEARVLGLLAPFAMGGHVAAGWSIGDVSIQTEEITVELRSGDQRGALRLRHPSRAPEGTLASANFAIELKPDDLPEAVRAALIEAVRRNDRVSLWSEPPDRSFQLGAWANPFDGAFLALLALAFLLAAVIRHLAGCPRWVVAAVAAVTALAVFVRIALAVEAPMNAWPYARVVPVARWLFQSDAVAWLSRAHGISLTLVDLIFGVDLVMASLTPAALFAHARALLRNPRVAIVASLLLATSPMHVRFSRSDVEFIQSLLASSMTFVALYGSVNDSSRLWRSICQIALPLLCLATYLTRPENLVFFALDFGALYVTARGSSAPRARIAWVSALVIGPALVAIAHLMPQYGRNVAEGLSFGTLSGALTTLVSPTFNTLVNPSITPLWMAPLAVIGFRTLWRRGERQRAVFLAAWLGAFFVVESYVVPHEVAMQARYHLHLVTPFVLLAAASLPWLLERSRLSAFALVVGSLASPLLFRGFVRDTDFYEMEEFAFLRRVSAEVPAECVVLEFRGAMEPKPGGRHFDSRWARFASELSGGHVGSRFRVVTADVYQHAERGSFGVEVLSDEARAVLASPPSCAMIYLGLSCVAQRPPGASEAPVCEVLRSAGELELVARETIQGRVYDAGIVGHPFRPKPSFGPGLLPPGTPVELALFKLARRAR